MTEPSSLQPDEIRIDKHTNLDPGFHVVDEDPVDPASGYDMIGHSLTGDGIAHY